MEKATEVPTTDPAARGGRIARAFRKIGEFFTSVEEDPALAHYEAPRASWGTGFVMTEEEERTYAENIRRTIQRLNNAERAKAEGITGE